MITRVNAYTTKTIAHRDDNPGRVPAAPPVTWAELDAALDAVGTIYKKYYRLRHPGEALGALTPLKSPGWIQMFQVAWMPPGFIPPDDHRLRASREHAVKPGRNRGHSTAIGRVASLCDRLRTRRMHGKYEHPLMARPGSLAARGPSWL